MNELRDAWIDAENKRAECYNKFMDANKKAPYRKELDEAQKAADNAKSAYAKALQTKDNG